uniref:Uncharacterized protein n=1 Tax=Anguilla anguilla TaxID=7936 RepID=A0A0E9QKV6_ANGAN
MLQPHACGFNSHTECSGGQCGHTAVNHLQVATDAPMYMWRNNVIIV